MTTRDTEEAGSGESAPSERGARIRSEVRERVEAINERFEEPVRAVTGLTRRTMALFPVRVWRRFLAGNGFLLSAGMSYQALFAVFAAVYVAFAVFGIWLGGSEEALTALEDLINTYVPGLIGTEGAINPDQLLAAAGSSVSLFGWTGAVALAGLIWTAIGWITYSRTAVRTIFGLPKDTRSYVLLKARDLVAAIAFGAVLLVGAAVSVLSTSALDWLFSVLGLNTESTWFSLLIGSSGFVLVFAIDTGVLLTMFRFLSGASVRWRRLWGGSTLGAAGLVVLQIGGGFLVGRASTNPLLATFTVFIGLLLWFRITAIVTLVAAAWISVRASDRNESLRRMTPAELRAEREAIERNALVVAARVRLREAKAAADAAGWIGGFAARRRVREAQAALDAELVRQEPSASLP